MATQKDYRHILTRWVADPSLMSKPKGRFSAKGSYS